MHGSRAPCAHDTVQCAPPRRVTAEGRSPFLRAAVQVQQVRALKKTNPDIASKIPGYAETGVEAARKVRVLTAATLRPFDCGHPAGL